MSKSPLCLQATQCGSLVQLLIGVLCVSLVHDSMEITLKLGKTCFRRKRLTLRLSNEATQRPKCGIHTLSIWYHTGCASGSRIDISGAKPAAQLRTPTLCRFLAPAVRGESRPQRPPWMCHRGALRLCAGQHASSPHSAHSTQCEPSLHTGASEQGHLRARALAE